MEPIFHDDSYGYRPGKSAIDALGVARQRCWRHDWVVDLDIKGFFDSIDWTLRRDNQVERVASIKMRMALACDAGRA